MSGNWKDRIATFEQAPPAGVWNSIAEKLDKETTFQNNLLHYEEMPPTGIWEAIASRIDAAEKKAPVIPAYNYKKRNNWWKYAAAASVLGLIFISIYYSVGKKQPDNTYSIASGGSVKSADTVSPSGSQPQIPVAINQSPEKKQVNNFGKKVTAKKDDKEIDIAFVQPGEAAPLAGPPEFDKNKKLLNSDGETNTDISLMNSPNTYVTITGPNGEPVRVSSKFSQLIAYLDDRTPATEEYLDKVIKESTFWKGKFKSWRDKMINNSITPTPSNFMDIIELSTLVKEK